MRRKLKNKYFILRHGETTHQTKKSGVIYCWPEDKPPASLTKKGRKQIEKRAQELKNKKFAETSSCLTPRSTSWSSAIDFIFSSDIFRTRQTAGIVVKELGLRANFDKRLRDINWGAFQGKPGKEAWAYYKNMKERFKKAPKKGESWLDCQKRMIDFIKEVDKKYNKKTILIISHGDPLWLLDSWVRKLSQKEMLKERKWGCPIKIADLKKLN